MPKLELTREQERVLVDLGLPTRINTDVGLVRWSALRGRVTEAMRDADAYREQVLAGVLREMDALEPALAQDDEHAREVEEAMVAKMAVARVVMQGADFMGLDPGDPEGAPSDEYDFEAAIIAGALPSRAEPELAARTVSHVLSRSFGVDVDPETASEIGCALLKQMPDDGLDPDDFPWPVIEEILDRSFAELC